MVLWCLSQHVCLGNGNKLSMCFCNCNITRQTYCEKIKELGLLNLNTDKDTFYVKSKQIEINGDSLLIIEKFSLFTTTIEISFFGNEKVIHIEGDSSYFVKQNKDVVMLKKMIRNNEKDRLYRWSEDNIDHTTPSIRLYVRLYTKDKIALWCFDHWWLWRRLYKEDFILQKKRNPNYWDPDEELLMTGDF